MNGSRLEGLLTVASEAGTNLLILPHTDPDPDAIASAIALAALLEQKADLRPRLVYSGIVGRAENRAMMHYLGNPLLRLNKAQLRKSTPIALVDTQPEAGNNALPQGRYAAIVIDHHPLRESASTAAYSDVRPEVGSTSTILWEYLQAAGIEPQAKLATALFYGIKTDTMGLGRGASSQDISAYFDLQRRIDVEALVAIEQARVPAAYFKGFADALDATRIYDGLVITDLGELRYPDLAAEMADELSRLQDAKWVICMGTFRGNLMLSVRTRDPGRGAGTLARGIVGGAGSAGGHGALAGGQIPLREEDQERVKAQLIRRALDHLEVGPMVEGISLLDL